MVPPYRVSAGETTPCPRCQQPLTNGLTPGKRFAHACNACGGRFVLHPELRAEVEDAVAHHEGHPGELPVRHAHPEREVRYLKCIMCDKPMNRSVFGKTSGIIVDTCKVHGTWFDKEELEDVILAIQSGALEGNPQKLVEPNARPPLTDKERMLRQANAAMQIEAISDRTRIEEDAGVISDLLWILGVNRARWF